jgi:hypothetical protein
MICLGRDDTMPFLGTNVETASDLLQMEKDLLVQTNYEAQHCCMVVFLQRNHEN